MPSSSLLSAVGFLFGTAVVGVIVHELSHAVALRLAGVSCTVAVLPDRTASGRFQTSVLGPLATVTPTRIPDDLSPWHLRVAAMMPLSLLCPFGLIFAGVIPNPFTLGHLHLELAAVAWLGCALPSPRDFSLLWYPERAISAHATADEHDE